MLRVPLSLVLSLSASLNSRTTTSDARDHPQPPCDEGTDARHLRRVLRNLCGRLAVGQHSRRIKIPCRTCGVSRIAEVLAGAAKVPDSLFSGPPAGDLGELGRKVSSPRSRREKERKGGRRDREGEEQFFQSTWSTFSNRNQWESRCLHRRNYLYSQ